MTKEQIELRNLFLTTAASANVEENQCIEDFDNWAKGNPKFTLIEVGSFLAAYILTTIPPTPPRFSLSYSEYADLTTFLPGKGGKDTNVVLTRNEEGDLLFELEGKTNITRFGKILD